jgi:hypothetical protein
MRMESDLS